VASLTKLLGKGRPLGRPCIDHFHSPIVCAFRSQQAWRAKRSNASEGDALLEAPTEKMLESAIEVY
jgi:hypothetical protein